MRVLKTIPEIPAIPAIVDSVFKVVSMTTNFVERTVTFNLISNYQNQTGPMFQQQSQAPMARTVSFDELGALLQGSDVAGFVAVARNAIALSMNVTLDKVPEDIFSE